MGSVLCLTALMASWRCSMFCCGREILIHVYLLVRNLVPLAVSAPRCVSMG